MENSSQLSFSWFSFKNDIFRRQLITIWSKFGDNKLKMVKIRLKMVWVIQYHWYLKWIEFTVAQKMRVNMQHQLLSVSFLTQYIHLCGIRGYKVSNTFYELLQHERSVWMNTSFDDFLSHLKHPRVHIARFGSVQMVFNVL